MPLTQENHRRVDRKQLKVLQVLPALDNGGVERGTLEIAEALVGAGHRSVVLSAGGRLVGALESAGSRHVTWDIGRKHPGTLLQIRKLRAWLAEEKFDIIHVRSRMPAWITWLAWRKLPENIRSHTHLVSTMHGLHSVNRYSAIMTCGEKVIAVSDTCRLYILNNYPDTDPAKVITIFRGVDAAAFPANYSPAPDWQRSWAQTYPGLEDHFVVTLPGRLTRLKGHTDFLTLIADLKQRGIPVKGLIVGGEDPKRREYAREIRQLAQNLNLEDTIVFTGHRSDMKEIYAISDAVLSLSTKPESFGRTVLEALAIGTPVVGYAQGGVGEILTALYPEGACSPGDRAAITSQLERLYRGQTTPVQENTHFLLKDMCAKTLDLYQELCQHPSGS